MLLDLAEEHVLLSNGAMLDRRPSTGCCTGSSELGMERERDSRPLCEVTPSGDDASFRAWPSYLACARRRLVLLVAFW